MQTPRKAKSERRVGKESVKISPADDKRRERGRKNRWRSFLKVFGEWRLKVSFD